MISDIDLAYISKHAISPLHERDGEIDSSNVRGVTAFIGILGHLTRNSTKQWPANCACISATRWWLVR
jgi:hypothetical protein